MSKHSPVIDAYIAKSADFAKPILEHLRDLIHEACPEVEEKTKWSMPHFDYLGEMMCSMAAFKQHCAFGFWKASLMKDPKGIMQKQQRGAMGHFDRITSIKDLPPAKVLIAYIKEAMKLNEEGMKANAKPKKVLKPLAPPADLVKALSKNKKAKIHFDAFTPGKRNEYIVWITDAKSEETRAKRMTQATEWIAEGKSRNWKYEKK